MATKGPEGRQPTTPDLDVGLNLYYLWLTSNQWIRRRVETAELLGPNSLQRRVSLDFVLPDLSVKGAVPVPLALLEKRPMVSFDMADATGRAISVYTREENGKAAWAMLRVAAMTEIVKATNETPQLDEELLADLRGIVFASQDDAAGVLEAFVRKDTSEQRRALIESPQFMGTARTLAQLFMLLTPLRNEPGTRHVLKFAYCEALGRLDRRYRLAETMGWRPARLEFAVPAVGEAESFHFELRAPAELDIYDSELWLKDPVEGNQRVKGTAVGSTAHTYTSGNHGDVDGAATVWLSITSAGLIRSGLILSSLSLLVLTSFFLGGLSSPGADAASAILLTLPALIATFIVRPGEHGVVTDLLLGVRMTVAFNGALAYLAALLLILEVSQPLLGHIWLGLLGGAALCFASLAMTMFPLPAKDVGSSTGSGLKIQGRKT